LGTARSKTTCNYRTKIAAGSSISLKGLQDGDKVVVYINHGNFKYGLAKPLDLVTTLSPGCRDTVLTDLLANCGPYPAVAFECPNCKGETKPHKPFKPSKP
jgi:hypothetical protein